MKILDVAEDPFHSISFRSSGKNGRAVRRSLPFCFVTVKGLPKKIGCIVVSADLQGREGQGKNRLLGRVVAEELAVLEKQKTIPKVGLVLLAGDLYDVPGCDSRGGTGKVTKVWNAFAKRFPYVMGVHGNHDIVTEDELLENVCILDGTVSHCSGLTFGGVSGVIGRIDRNQRKTEDDFMAALKSVTKHKPDLVLLHEGPDDPERKQRGNPVIREHLERKYNGITVFGHRFWEQPFQSFGKSQLLNTDSRVFVLLNNP